MASLANITVKKNDGTTDIVWTGVCPSSGDGVPALWRSETVGSAPGHKPTLELSTRYNGARTARRIDGKFIYPQIATDSTTGLTTVVNRVVANISMAVPDACPTTDINEAVSQMFNLLVSTLVKDSFKTGFAPT